MKEAGQGRVSASDQSTAQLLDCLAEWGRWEHDPRSTQSLLHLRKFGESWPQGHQASTLYLIEDPTLVPGGCPVEGPC